MQNKIMLGLTLVVLVALNYGIYQKEQTIAHGQTILLELAPLDPRSLMQGDYMRLRYTLESNTPKEHEDVEENGYIVIQPDQYNVAQFVRFHQGESLGLSEKLLHYNNIRHGTLNIVPRSFLFQEGHAKYYENAQYGVFKFGNDGKYVLTGLADKERNTISAK